MPKRITPISIDLFPRIPTNCFGFAIGNTDPVTESSTIYNMDHHLPIAEAFLRKLSELGYEEFPRQIQPVEEAHGDEYVIMVFDFTEYPYHHPLLGLTTEWDYHVVRREVDGTWVHKPGWKEPPCKICTDTDWEDLYEEFGSQYVLFAVAAK